MIFRFMFFAKITSPTIQASQFPASNCSFPMKKLKYFDSWNHKVLPSPQEFSILMTEHEFADFFAGSIAIKTACIHVLYITDNHNSNCVHTKISMVLLCEGVRWGRWRSMALGVDAALIHIVCYNITWCIYCKKKHTKNRTPCLYIWIQSR